MANRTRYTPFDQTIGSPMSKGTPRYHFLGGGRFADTGPVRPMLIVGMSIALVIVSRSPVVIAVSVVFALIGVYALIRDRGKRPGFFVELRGDHLLLNILNEVKIPYDNIAMADNPVFTQGPIGQWIGNAAVSWNHLFGGDFPRVGTRGELNTSVLEIRLRRTAWYLLPLPPFIVPRKRWRLVVEGADSLKAELQERLHPARLEGDTR